MDIYKTRDELVDMAADELRIVGSGQSLANEDQEKIDSRFDGLMAELAAREVCYVANEDEIPIEWSGALSLLLADECAMSFGLPKMGEAARDAIMDRLKILTRRNEPANRYLQVDTGLRGGAGRYTFNRWQRDL